MTGVGRRGQPVAALALLLAAWTGARSLLWESPFVQVPVVPVPILASGREASQTIAVRADPVRTPQFAMTIQTTPARPNPIVLAPEPQSTPVISAPFFAPAAPPQSAPELLPLQVAGGHQMLWMAAMAHLPLPAGVLTARQNPVRELRKPWRPARWGADGWFLWREGGTGFNLPGAGLPGANLPVGTYGASQYGAVLRFRVAPGSGHQPTLFLRGTGSVERPRYQEAALGLSLRPVPKVPVSASVELRTMRSFGVTRARPALALVSELPPINLPLAARAEAYVQAGYVGGKGATAFVDGQLRIDRTVTSAGRFELRAGGGAWGGAQQGAKRLDIGPSATLGVSTGQGTARLSADWRFRIAGRAAPSSGPAITLSAGF